MMHVEFCTHPQWLYGAFSVMICAEKPYGKDKGIFYGNDFSAGLKF